MTTNTLSADAMLQIILDLEGVGVALAHIENHPRLRAMAMEHLGKAKARLLRASLSDVAVETERRAA